MHIPHHVGQLASIPGIVPKLTEHLLVNFNTLSDQLLDNVVYGKNSGSYGPCPLLSCISFTMGLLVQSDVIKDTMSVNKSSYKLSDNNPERDAMGKEAKNISRIGDASCKDESLLPPEWGEGSDVINLPLSAWLMPLRIGTLLNAQYWSLLLTSQNFCRSSSYFSLVRSSQYYMGPSMGPLY